MDALKLAELLLKGFRKNKKSILFKIGAVILTLLVLLALIGLFYTPYSTSEMSYDLKCKAPSWQHIFGTDNFGRDVFSRVMKGISTTILIACSVVLTGTVMGTIIGMVSGYYGGIADELIMRFNDALASFPGILIALLLISLTGAGKKNLIISLGIVFIPSYVRMVRADVITVKNLEYIKAARLVGTSDFNIMFRHILPNIQTTIITSILVGFQNAILSEASMSYLGLGVTPPDPSLGRMLFEAQTFIFNAPWYVIAPGITIFLLTLSVGFVAQGFETNEEV